MECWIVQGCDPVGAQYQLFKPTDTLEGSAVNSWNLIMVQVYPEKLAEVSELIRQQSVQFIVAQGEALAAYWDVFWDI